LVLVIRILRTLMTFIKRLLIDANFCKVTEFQFFEAFPNSSLDFVLSFS